VTRNIGSPLLPLHHSHELYFSRMAIAFNTEEISVLQYLQFMKRTYLLIIFALCILTVCTSCVRSNKTATTVPTGKTITTKTGLMYQVVVTGKGSAAASGQSVRIHEIMKLADGTLLYSTYTNNKPVKFLLGGNQVIAGVDEGVMGMRVGERRKLIVPPALSKRSSYPANTPPDAVLYYDIELVEILDN
jgi:hypothetical protein